MKLFVGKNCIPCKMTKSWLAENKIDVDQVVAEDNVQEAKDAGVKALPSLVLDNGEVIQGYDKIKAYFSGEDSE